MVMAFMVAKLHCLSTEGQSFCSTVKYGSTAKLQHVNNNEMTKLGEQ